MRPHRPADDEDDDDGESEWRDRHGITWLVMVAGTALADFVLAGFMFFSPHGTPAYVYGTSMTVLVVEGLYIAVTCGLIWFHVGTKSHWDCGTSLLPMWCSSLSVNITFFLGAYTSGTVDSLFWIGLAIGVISQVFGLVLIVMSLLRHILRVRDDHPETFGFHSGGGEKGGHRSRWRLHLHRRRRKKKQEDSEEDSTDDGRG
ncbi:hypothetical protein JCM10207_009135 [Rhodosporidiobolus poonsookiae]